MGRGDPPTYWCLHHDVQEVVERVYQVNPSLLSYILDGQIR